MRTRATVKEVTVNLESVIMYTPRAIIGAPAAFGVSF